MIDIMDSGAKNISTIGEASFSAYLNSNSEYNFIQKLTRESNPYPPKSIILSPDISSPKTLRKTTTTKGTEDDGEIGVFSAENYYNMKLDYSNPVIIDTASDNYRGYRNASQVELPRVKTKSRHGTPSVSSKSSWNSQSALLQNQYSRSLSRGNKKLNKVASGKSFFATLSCHRSCSSKKSVGVNEIFDHARETPRAKKQILSAKESLKSAHVFDLKTMDKEVIEMRLERKFSMLSWDAIPKSAKIQTNSVKTQQDFDIESDASSDLFEIDNIIPGTGSALSTSDCLYEPSETSIEWSVVTASAADVSVMSDYNEKKLTAESIRSNPDIHLPAAGGKVSKSIFAPEKDSKSSRPSGILLGCKSQKAISVAESTYKTNEKAKFHPQVQQQNRSQRSIAPLPAPVGKLQVQNML